ncbi:NAD(P)H-dependent oxidoreductase [Fodinicola acaciae]|uniref:NAD(P)H-dependent oxidoreductase n=1 Tax=Fodinicola acaciae TaxID=2681555 RepID=UPI0013D78DD7|nr:NAD(P)H-dependent oxidoreductase [Fodinicola acaciae]
MSEALTLIGHPRAGSRTGALARAVATAIGGSVPGLDEWRTLELAEVVQVRIAGQPDDRPTPPATGDDPFTLVKSARLVVVATPSFKGTYTGLLKAFIDLLPPGHLGETVVVPIAVAGSDAHVQSTSDTLRAVLVEVGATVPVVLGVPESALAESDAIAQKFVADRAAEIARALA